MRTNQTLRLWNLQTGEEIRCFEPYTAAVYDVAFSPDGRAVVSAGDKLILWEVASGERLSEFATSRYTTGTGMSAAQCVAFTPNGRVLTGHGNTPEHFVREDCCVRVWDAMPFRVAHEAEGHRGLIEAVARSPDGSLAVSGGEFGEVFVWELPA